MPGGCRAERSAGPPATRTRRAANLAASGPVLPVRQAIAVRAGASSPPNSALAGVLAAAGIGRLGGRPVGRRTGAATVTARG